MSYYDGLTKIQLLRILDDRDETINGIATQRDEYHSRGLETEKALKAAEESLAELEKVQQEIVVRLEQAYLAVVRAVLK